MFWVFLYNINLNESTWFQMSAVPNLHECADRGMLLFHCLEMHFFPDVTDSMAVAPPTRIGQASQVSSTYMP